MADDVTRINDLCTNKSHMDQEAGLKLAVATAATLQTQGRLGEMVPVVPNVVRHLERSGYPSVVGLALETCKVLVTDPAALAECNKWHFVQRVVACLDHTNVDVRVAAAVFLAQLGKDTAHHDTIALQRGYHGLIHMLDSEDPRVQLAGLVALRVLVGTETNISDFARANGFNVLFRLIRGIIKAGSPKVLAQALVLLRLTATNRTVAMEVKASKLDSDVTVHLSNPDEVVQLRTLEAVAAILSDDAGLRFVKANNTVLPMLTAYVAMTTDHNCKLKAQELMQRL